MTFKHLSVLIFAICVCPFARAAAPVSAPMASPAAAPNSYNIEIIVFRNGGGGGEDWSASGAHASLGGPGSEDGSAGAAQVGRLVGILPAAQYQLSADEGRLRTAGYAVLAHVAWTQTASSWGSRAGFTLARLGGGAGGVSGLVYLERGSYLHLGMSLRYGAYELSEMRRVKFYDKNYFDHPGFGVITLLTPTQGARPAGR